MRLARRFLPAVAALLAVPTIASAQLVGQTIGMQFLTPDQSTIVFDGGSAVVGAGVEFDITDVFKIDVAASSVTLASFIDPGAPFNVFPSGTFTGVRLYDAGGTAPAFTSVTIGSVNAFAFDASRISFNANEIFLDLRDLEYNVHSELTLNIGTATVTPEPASFALLGTGIVALGGAVVRRRRSA